MRSYLQGVIKKWQDWVGDSDLEQAIRSELYRGGFYGKSAKFERVRMIAVQRPGWIQVYRFELSAKRQTSEDQPEAAFERLYGLAMDDGRSGTDVRLFEDPDQRKTLFEDWTREMIVLRNGLD